MVVIDIVIVLVVVITIGYFYVMRNYNYWGRRGVSQLHKSYPTGNIPDLNSEIPGVYRFAELYQHFKKQKQLFGGIYQFFQPMALIVDLDLIKSVLIKDFNYFANRGLYYNEKDDPLSANLFVIEGNKWKNLRSKLTPTFTSGKLKMMFPTILSIANEFKKYLNLKLEKNLEIEMKDLLARFTIDVVGTCAFGLDCNSLKDPDSEFRTIGRIFFEKDTLRNLKLMFAISFRKLAKLIHLKMVFSDISNFFMKAFTDTIDYRENNNVQRSDLMNLLIQLKNNGKLNDDKTLTNTMNLTNDEIAAHASLFFLAGFESSSTIMTFTLYELCQNLEIQEKARQEVIRVMKKHNNELTYDSVMEMKYIDQILNESQRKYPPTTLLVRSVEEDYKVPNSNHILEKGIKVGISVYGIHHDSDYYPHPDVNDPERFTDEMVRNRNPFTFLPIGEGPRKCIGFRFGLLQARIGLAMLLLNFKFSHCSKSVIPLRIAPNTQTLTPAGGLYLNIEKVES